MFDAVIFDWDGTLADTKHVVVLSFQKVLREIGCKVSDNFLEKMIGIGARNMFKEALKTANMPFDDKVIGNLVEKKNRIQLRLTNRIELFDGAVDILDSLYAKVKIALATMSNRKVVNRVLAEKGISRYFDYVITADEVQHPKPDPEVFLKCARGLRCQPEKCVVVEDSVFGVLAARMANMKCIAVPSGAYSTEELEKEKPDLIVNSIEEKQKILNYILA
jgi:HAD superfamily hydrolase (TIGR01509 family)